MSGEVRRSLLVVAIPPSVFARFPPLLWRGAFDVGLVDNPRVALKAAERTPFSLILVRFPLPGLEFQRFLDDVRAYGSPCRQSPMAAVVAAADRAAAEAFVGRGLNRVLVAEDHDASLARSLAELLEVAPRTEVRLPIDLRAMVRSGDRRLLAQTVDLSTSGMLITDPGGFGIGVEFRFDLQLPDDQGHVSGLAEVVRIDERGIRRGCGARFVTLDGSAAEALQRFLDEAGDEAG